jgi:hypothetical protein|uniref:Uncharacterized protein n=1 Tax=Podoviridae sp. ctz6O13 TaxID=2827757 RepID=A0A8S5TKW8_9CAUD|nr:MAG TPA: hypothetical protein [Podoviridae sp. ctz6O13]
MIDIKVSLNVLVPGAKMFSKQLCFKNSTIKNKKGKVIVVETPVDGMTETFSTVIPYKDKVTGKTVNNRVTLHIPACKPARQVLHMSNAAYEDMLYGGVPKGFRCPGQNPKKVWSDMSEQQRLEWHLARIAGQLGGIVESYHVAED